MSKVRYCFYNLMILLFFANVQASRAQVRSFSNAFDTSVQLIQESPILLDSEATSEEIVDLTDSDWPNAKAIEKIRSAGQYRGRCLRRFAPGKSELILEIPVGEVFECTGTYDNTSTEGGGPFPVTNVVVTMEYPLSFLTPVMVIPAGAFCEQAPGLTVCTFATHPPGAVSDIVLDLIGTVEGFFEFFGFFTQNEFDPNQSDNQESVPITIIPEIPTFYSFHLRKFWDYELDGIELGSFGIDDIVFELRDNGGVLVSSQTSMSMDVDESGSIDPISETGWVWFDLIPQGEYTLTELVPPGYSSTLPSGIEIPVIVPLPPEIEYIIWGNTGPVDWGDLPDPGVFPCAVPGGCYPTLAATAGAHHLIQPIPFMLGTAIDPEADGQPDRLATGDGADEDGLEDLVINPNGSITLDVRVTDPKSLTRRLDVFIDLNDDGDFDLPAERVITAHAMTPNAVTAVTTDPLGYDENDLVGYIRLRLSSAGGLTDTGAAGDGEVEDYADYGIDWGDLPDPRIGTSLPCPLPNDCYRTLDVNQGPSHIFLRGDPVLGFQIDHEPDGQPDALALGDDSSPTAPFLDYNPGADTGDEDGLQSVNIEENGSLTLKVLFTDPKGLGGFLDVWIDLNDDGYLAYGGDGSGRVPEDVVIAFPLAPGLNDVNTGILTPPLLPDEGLGFMRLRMSSTGGLIPYLAQDEGEVEDYFFPATDFGDAPEALDPDHPDIPFGYPTTRSNNGAFHLASQAVRIGAESDGEADGQPTTFANGDDMTSTDDEDGIRFDGDIVSLSFKFTPQSDEVTVVPGLISGDIFEVIVNPSVSGKIDAWMDWNADGDWEDAGENILSGAMVNPPEDTLLVSVPGNAADGFSFGRFRFSINGSQSFTGEADNGEVEDYLYYVLPFVEINSNGDGGDSNPGDGICDDGSGNCTLRAAMEESNASGRPFIFTIPQGTGKRATVFQPATPFPTITSPFFLDGNSQLEIDGSLAGANANGFVFEVDGGAIVSTMIHSFGGDAIRVTGSGLILEENNIFANGGSGIVIVSGTKNSIRTNTIFNNGGLGIDLGDDGVTLNDFDDADAGANSLQNYPELTLITSENAQITGTLSSAPNAFFVLEFYSSPGCDASGYGEGAVFLGDTRVQTDGAGNVNFTVNVTTNPILIGDAITATANSETRNSSEFSECILAVSTSVERVEDAEVPQGFTLGQNYPNPFNPVTNITFGLSRGEFVTIEVFNLLGKRIEVLVTEWKEAGEYSVSFDAGSLPSGIYLYRMTAGSFTSSKQLTLLK